MNVSNLCPTVESTSWSILGRGKPSFGHAFVQVDEVYTLPPFSVCFLYSDDVREPFRIVHLPDEPCRQEFGKDRKSVV